MNTNLPVFQIPAFAVASALGLLSPATASHQPPMHGSGAPALSTSNLTVDGGALFEARFDWETLEGDLVARAVDVELIASSAALSRTDAEGYAAGLGRYVGAFHDLWRASDRVTAQSRRAGGSAQDRRIIFTSGDDGAGGLTGRRFLWSDALGDALTGPMKTMINPATPVDSPGDPVVDWVRGHDALEGGGETDLRQRNTVLGNLSYGAPLYVGPPNRLLADPGYDEFRAIHRGRPPLVFAGGSDGMLHAFSAVDGSELFAYIPAAVLGALKERSAQQYVDKPLVSGPLVAADAFGDFPQCAGTPCWRSILIGALGAGGRSIYALDITNPRRDMGELNKESNAAARLFLWEFEHELLASATTRPAIAKLSDGTWVVIAANGPGAGRPVLFVIDIALGTLLYAIEPPSTADADGLSSPEVWDADSDGDADTVYAGDLGGNLWKFDVSRASGDADDGRDPLIALSGRSLISLSGAQTGAPASITTGVAASTTPDGRLMLYFGTLGSPGTPGGIYGIRDENKSWGVNPPLVVHSLEAAGPVGEVATIRPGARYRIVASSSDTEGPVGWHVPLPLAEQVAHDPALNSGRIEFLSAAAEGSHGTGSWLNGVNYLTGGAPESPFLDVNRDGNLDADDVLRDVRDDGDVTPGDDFVPVGVHLGPGVVSAPATAVVAGGRRAVFITRGALPGSTGPSAGHGMPGGRFGQGDVDPPPTGYVECGGHLADELDGDCAARNDILPVGRTPARQPPEKPGDGANGGVTYGNPPVADASGGSTLVEIVGSSEFVPPDRRVSWREVPAE